MRFNRRNLHRRVRVYFANRRKVAGALQDFIEGVVTRSKRAGRWIYGIFSEGVFIPYGRDFLRIQKIG